MKFARCRYCDDRMYIWSNVFEFDKELFVVKVAHMNMQITELQKEYWKNQIVQRMMRNER